MKLSLFIRHFKEILVGDTSKLEEANVFIHLLPPTRFFQESAEKERKIFVSFSVLLQNQSLKGKGLLKPPCNPRPLPFSIFLVRSFFLH